MPASIYHVSIVSISDRLLPESSATFNVSTKDGLTVTLEVQARWSIDRSSLLAKWSGLPPNPGETVVGPVLASAFRVVAPAYDATQILADKREALTTAAAQKAAERLRESGIVLKDLLIQNLTLPEEYQKGRLALLREGQEADRKEVTLRIREKEIEEGRLIAEAEKVKKEKAAEVEGFQRIKTAETDAAQKLIAAKADSDAMQYILPLKEKAIQQEKLMAEAEKQKRLKQAEAEAEAMKIQTAGDADKRRTLADADAYAIRVTSQAQFENLKKEVELVQANPVWVSKVFAEKISDKVQVILTPQLTSNVFNDEVLKRVANGKSAVAKREIPAARAGAPEPTAAARPAPTPAPEPADPDEGTR